MTGTDSYDYVVVGAGSAGAVVAARLARGGARVALLEAGRGDDTRLLRVPGMTFLVHTVPRLKARVCWKQYSVPQTHAGGRRIPMTRGRVLGGSSSVNGMVFVRGNRANYDGWAEQGCDGWGFEQVLPAFKRMEDWRGAAGELRGTGGPIAVTTAADVSDATRTFLSAAAHTLGAPIIDDYNGASQHGLSLFQQSAADGVRYSSARGYLREPHLLPNLHVHTGIHATRVVIEKGRALGVEVLDGAGSRIVRATSEVVLSAGVIGSAHLLLLSGIGPAAQLRDHGIEVHADLPVGENLQDHLFVPMTYLVDNSPHRGTVRHFLGGLLEETLRPGSGWFGRTFLEGVGFVRTSRAGAVPDLQLHLLPWSYVAPNQDRDVLHRVDPRPALTVMPTMIYPRSRGTVRLAAPDPLRAPLIDPAYLSDPADAELLLEGMAMTREIMAHNDIAGHTRGELHPGPRFADPAALRRELPHRIHSVYHPVGTCRMGVDEGAVVDPRLRVRGVDGLRVADASIMPTITGGNTNAPALMIGEMCAAFMSEP
ncbi:GMC family oxidoreductase [Nocardia sp. NPDC055321]